MNPSKILLVIAGLLLSLSGFAQQDMMLYNVSQIPQSSYLNPAIIPETRINIGFPGINFNTNSGKSAFQTTDAFYRDEAGRLNLNTESLLNSFDDRNEFRFNTSTDLLHVGFQSGLSYFQFNITEHGGFDLNFPREAAVLVREIYEERYFGQNILVEDMQFNATHYREFGFGFARQFTRRLNVGARIKYLYGVSNFSTMENSFHVDTELTYVDGNNTVGGALNYQAQTAGMDAYRSGKMNEGLLIGQNNAGFAADLGIQYKVNNFLDVSASGQNMFGFIRWNDNVRNFNQPGREIKIDPLELVDMFEAEDEFSRSAGEQFDALLDSLIGGDPEENNESFTTRIPTRINLAAALSLTNSLTLNVLNQNVIHADRSNRAYVKTMFHARLKRFFTAIVGYDLINEQVSARNLGLGFCVNAGPLQFYTLMEDVFMVTTTNQQVNGVVRFGMNLTIGRDNI